MLDGWGAAGFELAGSQRTVRGGVADGADEGAAAADASADSFAGGEQRTQLAHHVIVGAVILGRQTGAGGADDREAVVMHAAAFGGGRSRIAGVAVGLFVERIAGVPFDPFEMDLALADLMVELGAASTFCLRLPARASWS